MRIERTLDVGICLDVLMNENIFNSISEDGGTIEDLKVDVLNDYWLKITVDDIVIGVVQFKQMFNKCYDSHIHILPEHRKANSLSAGDKILEWCGENINGSTLYTNVPSFCENVKLFLIKFGFVERGVIPNAWNKNGKLNDMTILTRGV